MYIKTKKNSYLLLELMIGLTLLALCALPLIRAPIWHIQKQIGSLEDIHLHLESERTLARFKESLYTSEISWGDLEMWAKQPAVIIKESFHIPLLGSHLLKTCRIKSVQIKSTEKQEAWAKVILEISFTRPIKPNKKVCFLHYLTAYRPSEPGSTI
ncbi:MAG: hypothetical protein NTZ52_07665 [Chlamydiae bacterium]|nr:hypothetical protein [Chlamydiota bacterium]